MPHLYGPESDLGPEGYHSQCANCGYEYGTHSANGERCPTRITQPESPHEDEVIEFDGTQKFTPKNAS